LTRVIPIDFSHPSGETNPQVVRWSSKPISHQWWHGFDDHLKLASQMKLVKNANSQ